MSQPLPLRLLGPVSWADSQSIYHAQAHLGQAALNILWPAQPYVCIGRFQDLELEVDEGRCREMALPIVRREVGGGAVYLDAGQVFYQLVLPDRATSRGHASLFSLGLSGVVQALGHLGVSASMRGTNDVVVGNRKISGNGAGIVGQAAVVVGNILLDFNYAAMAAVLHVPDEKFRDKAYQSMRENLVSLAELRPEVTQGQVAETMAEALRESLAPEYEVVPGELLPAEITAALPAQAAALTDEAWLHSVQRQREVRRLRVRQGVTLFENRWKSPGGLIRCSGALESDIIAWISLSGDFFVLPADSLSRLEARLQGRCLDEVEAVAAEFLAQDGVEMPGVSATDIANAVRGHRP